MPEKEFRPRVRKVTAGEADVLLPSRRFTREDYVKAGLEKFIVEGSDHQGYYASLWPNTGRGLDFLGLNWRYRIPHISTNSVLIVVISNHYQDNVW